MTGTKRDERISPALKFLGWHRAEQLIEMRDSVKLFKALHFESGPEAVRDMFVARSDVSKRATRASDAGKLHLPRYHLELAKKSFRYRAAVTWNALPKTLTDSTPLPIFKRAIRKNT